MQILPGTGKFIAYHSGDKWRGVASLYEVKTSIDYGVWYYEYLLKRLEGNERAAMAAYNWGPQHIERRLRSHRGLPVVYPRKVLSAQEKVKNAFRNEYRKRVWWTRDPRMDYPDYAGESSSDVCPDQPPEPVVKSPRALT
jgi:soluble lytic murein transglycosylase-like protein